MRLLNILSGGIGLNLSHQYPDHRLTLLCKCSITPIESLLYPPLPFNGGKIT